MSGEPGAFHAKLADFGLAKNFVQAGFSGISSTGMARGTLEFMPSEQAMDSKYAGPEVDLYAMGGVLFFCLTGRRMYDVAPDAAPTELLNAMLDRRILPLRSIDPKFSVDLENVVERAVGRDKFRQFKKAEQMIRVLESVMSSHQKGEAQSDVGKRTDDSR